MVNWPFAFKADPPRVPPSSYFGKATRVDKLRFRRL